jgi:uncharacterized protein YxjI
MRDRAWSIGSQFTIEDEQGRAVAQIASHLWSLGDKLSFQDLDGNEIAKIVQQIPAWTPTYEILRDGATAAHVRKKAMSWTPHLDVELAGGVTLAIDGDWTEHEYSFDLGGRTVARVSKQWWPSRDTYGVEVASDQDAILILALTVVIEMIHHHES